MSPDNIKHILTPPHSRLSDKEKEKILNKYNIDISQLPKILKNDPAIQDLDVKEGDIIKIVRSSPTAGTAIYYRVVING